MNQVYGPSHVCCSDKIKVKWSLYMDAFILNEANYTWATFYLGRKKKKFKNTPLRLKAKPLLYWSIVPHSDKLKTSIKLQVLANPHENLNTHIASRVCTSSLCLANNTATHKTSFRNGIGNIDPFPYTQWSMDHYNTAILCKSASDINAPFPSHWGHHAEQWFAPQHCCLHRAFSYPIQFNGNLCIWRTMDPPYVKTCRRRESWSLKATWTTNTISLHRQEEVK